MAEERNFGVTEARLGLTLLTCLLIALGFAILQRLGDTGASPIIEIPQSQHPDEIATGIQIEPLMDDDQPQVLPTHSGDSSVPRVARQGSQPTADRYSVEAQPPTEFSEGFGAAGDNLFADPAIGTSGAQSAPGNSVPQ